MKNWWISWYHPRTLGEFELHSPWWVSGMRMSDDADTVCAAVQAEDADHARALIHVAYDEPPPALEWRFVTEMPDDWSPYSDRFPRGEWMPDFPAAAS